jgi:hypothetical protein
MEEVVDEVPLVEEPKAKKPRKTRRVVVQEVIAPEPVDFYDYPFTERIEQETIRTPVAVEAAKVTEYTVPVAETTYEWMIDEEDARYDRLFRDHLEPRRA